MAAESTWIASLWRPTMRRFDGPGGRGPGVVAVAVVVSLLSACTMDTAGTVTTPSNSASARASASRGASIGQAANCTSAQVHLLVNRFVRAFNAGDQPTLQRLWAQSGHGFDWYSTDAPGQRIDPAGRDRASLGAYFAERHARRETLRLTSFRFNGNAASYGNFQYTLIRQADDLPATAYVGKGAALCTTMPPTIGVWSMAKNPQTAETS